MDSSNNQLDMVEAARREARNLAEKYGSWEYVSENVSPTDIISGITEVVNHPPYYGGEDDPYETIKVIEAWGLDFHLGNAVKYISRAGKKGSRTKDLRKAAWYLNRAIENSEAPNRARVQEISKRLPTPRKLQ